MKDAPFTAARLLALYDRVANALDAIPRLRRLVLDLAVRGKLVEQDAGDEFAEELLKRIAKEKAKILEGSHGRHSTIPAEAENKFPFEIPTTWQWISATFPAVAVSELGKKIQTKEVRETGTFPVVDQGKIAICGFCDDIDKVIKVETPLILFGDHTRETKFIDFDFVVGADGVKLLQPVGIYDRYYFISLQWLPLESRGYGRHFKILKASHVPLPPLAEQHRIVAKVEELTALCDRLEAARAGREGVRDALTAATLHRLTAPEAADPANLLDPEDQTQPSFQSHARFALQTLPTLTTRPDQIKPLRQSILNLAVRGKLVEQDLGDEPATELLKRIKETGSALYSQKKIPKPKELPSLRDLDQPFTLPIGWAWSMLGELCYQVSDGPHFSPQYVDASNGVPFLSARNVRIDGFDLSTVKYVSRTDHEEFCKRIRPEKGDIIYTKGGTTGIARVNDLDVEFSVWVHLAVLRIEKVRLYPRYVELALNSPHCYEQSQRYTQGTSNFDLGLTRMIKITIPLPPLAEQHRIVAKVDALMALCDQLEASLTQRDATRSRLLNALIHEALDPIESEAA